MKHKHDPPESNNVGGGAHTEIRVIGHTICKERSLEHVTGNGILEPIFFLPFIYTSLDSHLTNE